MKKIATLLIIIALQFFLEISCYGALQPANLTCEYITNPLGIDIANPRFAWMSISMERNQVQSAYELIVSDQATTIQSKQGNFWSTGRITTSASTQIEYQGKSLLPYTRYYWSVRIFDQQGNASAWSEPAWFETAKLSDQWKGVWISDASKQFDQAEEFYEDDRMPLFRKEITITKPVRTARLYVSGLGYMEAFLNGKKIGDHVLDPGWTTYKKEVQYVIHDITSYLRNGKNVAGVMLGNGWWNPLPLRLFGRFNLRDFQQTGRPCVKGEIHIRYTDGSEDVIATDQTWLTAPGPVIRNNVYLGERYDARLEQPNWNVVSSSSSKWKSSNVVEGPSGALRSQMQPPIRITKVIKPVKVVSLKPGVFIVDMGQNFAGVARIKVKGKAGTKISMRYGEALHPDGSLNFLTTVAGQIKEIWKLNGGPGAPPTAWQEDQYILRGKGKEVWNPRFTFHGFRFIEVTGWPGTLSVNDIEGLRMNSDLPQRGQFVSSNKMFGRVHEAIQWTFLSNVFSVQSDCPGREKMGYGADMVTTANAYLYNYDMSNFYTKAVRDFQNEQQPDGGITEIAPYTGIHDKGVGGESGPLGWQLAFTYLQKRLYEFYGDKRIITDQYPAVIRQIEFLTSKSIDGLFHWDISDHVAIDPKPEALSASAFYYHHVKLAEEFAGILGKKEDSTKYAALSRQIKSNTVEKYLVPGTGRFDNGTQSAQLFALWYGLTPEKDKSLKVLFDEFERHSWHVSSGIFGVMMMFDVLRESDQIEIAYTLANQRDYPGWGFMLENGATTLWESWEYPDNAPSQNHPMFGSIDEWFYRSILGINPLAPGFKKIMIKPQPAGDLTWAKGSYQSIHGEIISDWKLQDGKFMLNVSIPANTQAEVWMPTSGDSLIKEQGADYKGTGKKAGNYFVVTIGSGEYAFASVFNK